MPAADLVVEVRGVAKDYRGLRPLRVRELELRQGESLALIGFDLAMAELFVNLVTGANLPDSGEVRIFGRPTASIGSADEWVPALDQFGLISERSVLVEQFTVEQNLAMPLSLDITDMPLELRRRVRELADEVSLSSSDLETPTGALSSGARLRLRLGRALALGPRVLLAEHPNAVLSAEEAPGFAADFSRVVNRRGLASIVLTADRTFAAAIADQVLTLEPATGVLKATKGWRSWFS